MGARELGELAQEGFQGLGVKGAGRVAAQGVVGVGAGEGRPGERLAVGRELKPQASGLGEGSD